MTGAIIVIICIIGAMIWGICAGKKRRDDMTLLAEELGLNFRHERDYHLADRYSFLDKLRKGSNRYACNVISGGYRNHEVTVFDYHYETCSCDSDGRRRTDHHCFSFFILTLPKFFPELTIAGEDLFSKIAQAVGYDDIDFENHEFSRKFAVRSKNRQLACDFCNDRMIEYLLNHENINIELDRNMLAIGCSSKLRVENIKDLLDRLIEIRSLMPDCIFGN